MSFETFTGQRPAGPATVTGTPDVLYCARCDETKDRGDFPPNADVYTGTSAYCRRCRAAWQRDYRARRPEVEARHRDRSRARTRALTRLGHRHRDELEALIRDELEREGTP